MKQTIFCLLFMLVASTTFATELKVKVLNYFPQEVLLIRGRTTDTLKVSPNGEINHSFTLNAPGDFRLVFAKNGKTLNLYAHDNYTLDIVYDLTTEKATFRGDGIPQNQFIAELNSEPEVGQATIAQWTLKQYMANLAERRKKYEDKLNKIDDENFVSRRTSDLDRRFGGDQFTFAYAKLSAGKAQEANTDPDFIAYLKTVDPNSKENVDSRLTERLIRWTIETSGRDRKGEPLDDLETIIRLVSNPEAREQLMSSALLVHFAVGGGEHSREAVGLFKKTFPNSSYNARFENSLKLVESLISGAMAPTYKLHDINDKEYDLADFRGKVLYLDIWATWCGPCLQQAPNFRRVAEQFKDDNRITFLSISVDDDVEAWKKYVTEHYPNEKHQYLSKGGMRNSDLTKQYGIAGIPRFMLIDKEGKLIDVSAPFPSSGNIVELIKSLLK